MQSSPVRRANVKSVALTPRYMTSRGYPGDSAGQKIVLIATGLNTECISSGTVKTSPDLNLTPPAAFLRFCRAQRALGKKKQQGVSDLNQD